ncbi:hypothetical protein ES706_03103 [subsurface metagenome]
MSTINSGKELEAYDQILKFFNKKDRTIKETEVFEDQTYISLMGFLKKKKEIENLYQNYKLVENAIILILSLFHDIPPDRYNSMGKDAKNIDNSDRDDIISMLKKEFLD